ncbi:MAG: hypothetical protein GQ546_09275 [Gammaproteobacteria bacterium]|nr:hypothetical protein [Gammaproteobacteria bacterium]
MDIATSAKLIGAFVAIFSIWRVIYEIRIGRKKHLREEYEFAKKFLNEVHEDNIHPYPLEKGYQAIAGTSTVKAYEIEYILSLKDPVQCLKDYVLSKQLMEKIETKGDLKLTFKSKYINSWSRNWRKSIYFLWYMFFAFIALGPFLLQSHLNTSLSVMAIQLIFTIPFGGFYAWSAANAFLKIKRGEHLVENQKKHTQRVIIKN